MPANIGNGEECFVRFSGAQTFAWTSPSTTPIVSDPKDIRNLDKVGVQLALTTANGSGAWTAEVSNDYVPTSGGLAYGQAPNAGTWSPATALFSPTIAAVAFGTAASLNQFTQAEIRARAIRFTFTPATGSGTAGKVIIQGKARG